MPPVAGAILGFYLSWRIFEVCLGPWHFTAPLFITHFTPRIVFDLCAFASVPLSLRVCATFCGNCLFVHFQWNIFHTTGFSPPALGLGSRDTTRHDRSVLCVVWNFLALPGEQPAVTSTASLPNTGWMLCCAAAQAALWTPNSLRSLSCSISLSLSCSTALSLCVLTVAWAGEQQCVMRKTPFWQLPGMLCGMMHGEKLLAC